MKLSPEKKKEILLQSFDVLKDNYSENSVKLRDILVKMFAVDTGIAVDMWKFLLKKYDHFIREDDEAYFLTEGIAYGAHEKIGGSKICEIVIKDDFLKQVIFNQSAATAGGSWVIIHTCIYSRNSTMVNDLLGLVYTNKNTRSSFGSYFEGLLDELEKDSPISEEVINVLLFWADKVTNKQEKAKINITLLDLASGEEEEDADDDE